MYQDHFGMHADPFALGPNLKFLYRSAAHAETMAHLGYGLEQGEDFILISGAIGTGKTLAYALFSLQDRGRLIIDPNIDVYEGQIVGLHSRSNDLTINPTKGKQLTNVRASGTDEALTLTPPVRHTLEQALEFIEDDELVEVTPESIRLRKKLLLEHERKRAARS